MKKISGVYKITNIITGDFYIGSSIDVERRWRQHKCPSTWKQYPNSQMYKDMQKYGVDKFRFEILGTVESEYLKKVEQGLIEVFQPTYNNYRAKGQDTERRKERTKKYEQSDRGKEAYKKYSQSEKGKERLKKYLQSEKGKEAYRKSANKYWSQLCSCNGETLTLGALSSRFRRAGIEHPTKEAKKYLLGQQ